MAIVTTNSEIPSLKILFEIGCELVEEFCWNNFDGMINEIGTNQSVQ